MRDIDCKKLVDSYVEWLRQRMTTADVNGVCEITTPFLDRHNDRLQIYVRKTEVGFRLTDDSYIIGDLESSGCTVRTPTRQAMLKSVLLGFAIHENEGELFVDATPENFPQKKHALLQAMISINDMFMTSKPTVHSLFIEDVRAFLEANDTRYSPGVTFTGQSGFPHRFDFVIPKSKVRPERLLRAINHPTREAAQNVLFAWTDIRHTRPVEPRAYAVLNDEQQIKTEVLDALHSYEIKPILWSRRNEFVAELSQ